MSLSRRGFMAAVAAAGAGTLLPPSVYAALAREPRAGGLRAIKHVVLLMQENRSFDHYYGTLRGVRGFSDRNALKGVFNQSGVLPFPVREAASGRDIHYIGDLDHSWNGGHSALRGGWNDNWVPAKTAATMAFYTRQDIPFHYELADTFTLCDAYHCSVPSSTSPNRNYWVSGYTGFEPSGARATGNAAYSEDTHTGYTWKTYPERLEAAGKSWRVYQEWDNFQDNNLEFYVRFKEIARKVLPAGFKSLDKLYGTGDPALIGSIDLSRLSAAEKSLYERGLHRVQPGGLGEAFRADVNAGRLPAVSYLVPSSVDSEHPGASSPAASASITYQVLDALASNQDVWESTVLFITYDENDGFYDHVPPPRPPLSVTDEYVGDRPLGLGARVPMTVVSPWSVGGYVCSQVFDHTSMTQFLERWTGVRSEEISAWRRTVTGDLTSAFDFDRRRTWPEVGEPAAVPPASPRWRPAPPSSQKMPEQEAGRRRARALPYQPDASLRGSTLEMSNSGSASAHFALYPYSGQFAVPQHFDVASSTSLEVAGDHDLVLLGPNGFRREFAGSSSDRARVSSSVRGYSRVLTLTFENTGTTRLTFVLGRRRYPVRPGHRHVIPWLTVMNSGWYDLTVTVEEEPRFRRRLCGHIENGQESISG
ncbi:phospholipase C, phosphocholine-specific [Lentzea sp. NEAU-D13]|uniref:phospholipase C n=1 Tax=Lentzea alba TaxID=2714351 RepID=A0A7C9VQZ5_9PSEU|nr:phospholipase C, phosphocholine-specific [Lentzea alba]NGY60772.1 phospholipase C, phosphocholine-specific [Lentzea alba]